MDLGVVMASSPAAARDIKALRQYLRREFNTEKLDGLDKVQFLPARQGSGNVEKKILIGTWGKWSIYAAYRYTLEGGRTGKRLTFLAEDKDSQMDCHARVLRDYVTYVEPFSHLVPLDRRPGDWFKGIQQSLGRYIEACFVLKGLTVGTSVETDKICRWLGVAVTHIREAQHAAVGFEAGHKISNVATTKNERLDTVVEEGPTSTTEEHEEYSAFDWSDIPCDAEKKLFESITAPFDLLKSSRKQIKYHLECLGRRHNKVENKTIHFKAAVSNCEDKANDLVNKSTVHQNQLNEHQRKYHEMELRIRVNQHRLKRCGEHIAIHEAE
ncbi:uncharacterized protein N0V89_005056 [Didymosphaeria variabile]|uniref:Uncharacterized protein n=1 Tax=Didymosphaeria variabile TaxID=1932322 RepID=A0A9W8XM57_9PLEO|nr:uncharacterized protein N0V89_005056 [Didymosphaeria variabile]KAJ4353328.1 hypothetical protein N0V89_005056 [Didymosphaeria variabile]